MKTTIYLLFVFWFFLPSPCYAYLDPGTGNALVYVVISFFGAVIFSLKSVFYAIIGKKDSLESEKLTKNNAHRIVLFSEGKAYWNTFKPIVYALLEKKAIFSYYTMDIEDPCLEIDDVHMNNRYIGNDTRAFAKIGNIKADIVLSTTPNIGTPGYPIPKSNHIKQLIHVFHSFEDMTAYHLGSLDYYDGVMLVGAFEAPILRQLETKRNLPAKHFYPAGLPYMDVLAKQYQKRIIGEKEYDKKTILIAPSWGVKGCLSFYGSRFIRLLAEADYRIIIRPHPQSFKVEGELLKRIKSDLSGYSQIYWDTEIDGTKSMQEADIMISDTSSVRVDFLFVYQKPIISLRIPSSNLQELEVADLDGAWKEDALKQFGDDLTIDEIDSIVSVVEKVLKKQSVEGIQRFRMENIYNWESAGQVIAEHLINLSEGEKVQEVVE